MQTTADFFDAVKARYNLPSDYAVAKMIGVHPNKTSELRKGKTYPSERACFALAELLDMDGVYVWACIKASKTEIPKMRKQWEEAAEKLAATG